MDNTRRNYQSGRLSDKDMLQDILNTEKQLSGLYDQAVMESSSIELHTAFEDLQRDEHENSFTVFNAMQQRGWYNQSDQNWQQSQTQNSQQPQSPRSRFGRKRNYDLSGENSLGRSQFFS